MEKDRDDILKYSGFENTLELTVAYLDNYNKTVLGTSSGNLAVEYFLCDVEKLSRIEMYFNFNVIWDNNIIVCVSSTNYVDYKFRQVLRIDDDGYILLIPTKSPIYV